MAFEERYKVASSAESAAALWKVDPATLTASWTATGQTVDAFRSHAIEGSFTLAGMTRQEFIDLHSGTQFSFAELEKEFKKAVPDYDEPIEDGMSSVALEFCSLVIFKIGPGSRTVKKAGRDTLWNIYVKDDAGEVTRIIVATFKNTPPKIAQPKIDKHRLSLTVKQASLLAIKILARIVPASAANKEYLLTPLAGSVFCKDDLEKISNELSMDISQVILMLNSSSQSGGFYLPNSDAASACIACLIATRNAEEKLMIPIVTKTVKQYNNHHKKIDWKIFEVLAQYATGGVPSGCSAKELRDKMNSIVSSVSVAQFKKGVEDRTYNSSGTKN